MNKAKNTVQAAQLPVNKLRPFEGHPFQVKDDAEMEQLVWSMWRRRVFSTRGLGIRSMAAMEFA